MPAFYNKMRALRHWPAFNKSSAVAEMGDRGHNRHGPKRGGAVKQPNTLWPAPRSTSVPSGVFIHNNVGCHSPRRNISTNYYLVVEMHTVTVRSWCAVSSKLTA